MYNKVDTNLNFVQREEEVLKLWDERKVFEKSIEAREGAEVFTFYDGPPTANGRPHIGHVLGRVIKDVMPRYKAMQGYKVLRKAGWDTHGLPVELAIEKKLGLDGKAQIEDYGIEPFIKECKESVWEYKGLWERFSKKVGYWVDMDDPYITYDNNYIESVWWSLKQIWDKDLLYKGHKIVPYCPRCGTALSSHEVAQGYKDVHDKTVIAKFEVKGKENEYILAWTTTPWTLPSNLALAVNPNETYVKVKANDEYYILAEALVEKVVGEAEVVDKFTGKELEGTEYKPLYEFAKVEGKAYYVVCADYVTLSDGTGVVHTAPAFGADDAETGRRYNLPFIQLVALDGTFKEDVTPWAGMFVKDADPKVIEELKERGLLFKSEDYEHSYPHCWRCDTPLIYYGKETWFIEMTKLRDKMVKNNKMVNWHPDTIGEGRFGNWIENAVDWALSRDRYWGTPLPIWECDCGHRHAIGSIEELKSMSPDCPEDIELHKPYVDNVHLNCDKCGKLMTRTPEVIDCWYDSGAMPFAQWHYPFENKEIFDNNFPANFISEGVDQTRGWFYSLLAVSTLLFDKPAYETVIVSGHVQDKDGKKMSKSKGNVVDPMDALNEFGADAIRWYFYSNSAIWLPNRFHGDAVTEGQRRFMGTFWNTYAFYVLYANIDNFDPTRYTLDKNTLGVMDKWVLSRLNTVIKEVEELMDVYKITEATKVMEKFVDDLSNWYVRRSRERFWAKGMEQDKVNAYLTLYTVLTEMSKVAAPFVPFIAENMYQNLVLSVDKSAKESVHLCDFPKFDGSMIDAKLEEEMEKVLNMVVLGRACRNIAAIKNRQPLSKLYASIGSELGEMYKDVVKEELNIKEVVLREELEEFATYLFKPNLKTLGPKYGKHLPKIREVLMNMKEDGKEMLAVLKAGDTYHLNIDGSELALVEEDVLVETVKSDDYAMETDGKYTVVLDVHMTDELIKEGYVREIISKIQNMRKEAGFEVQDTITLEAKENDMLVAVIENNKALILDEVMATDLVNNLDGFEKELDINGEKLTLVVKKN
ncbi:MAG: isoleucine--tRNA ligase [Clostridia bacterium]|jgi:isoleucyl-tRNA synthetase|nr:isoleucine--tRNA ligase [Clostridia bacterium]